MYKCLVAEYVPTYPRSSYESQTHYFDYGKHLSVRKVEAILKHWDDSVETLEERRPEGLDLERVLFLLDQTRPFIDDTKPNLSFTLHAEDYMCRLSVRLLEDDLRGGVRVGRRGGSHAIVLGNEK